MHTICGIWADVMRMGLLPEEKGKHDADWWLEHQNEIGFTLRVLMGLGFAVRPSKLVADLEGNESLEVKPSNGMKRLHRCSRAYYGYRHERDEQLRASVAQSTERNQSDAVNRMS